MAMSIQAELNQVVARQSAQENTIPGMFWSAVASRGGRPLLRQKERGIWRTWSWEQAGEVVSDLAAALESIGLEAGDGVCIVANTCREWLVSDLASLTAGGVVAGVYPSDPGDRLLAQCCDIGARVLFVEDEEQLDKFLTIRAQLPHVLKVVVFRATGLRGLDDPQVILFDQMLALGRRHRQEHGDTLQQQLAALASQAPAVVCYTAGTSGPPKAVVHSHASVLSACRAHAAACGAVAEGANRIAFTAPCHAMERIGGMYAPISMGHVLNFVEQPDTVLENLREIQPEVFFAVPRVWEKLYSDAVISMRNSTALQRAIAAFALQCGQQVAQKRRIGSEPGLALSLLHRAVGHLAMNSMKRAIGMSRIQAAASGFASISPDLIDWFATLGVDIRQFWGLTEAGGVVTMTVRGGLAGDLGARVGEVDLRVSEQGELLIRGESPFLGYMDDHALVQGVVADGWLRTGDTGRIAADGTIELTGRVDEVLALSDGRTVKPSAWENRLKASPYVIDAVLVGRGRQEPGCLVLIDQDTVEHWAQRNQVGFSDFRSLVSAPEVKALIQEEVDQVNAAVDASERVRLLTILERRLGPEDVELTAMLKLRRHVVEVNFGDVIAAMYANAEGEASVSSK